MIRRRFFASPGSFNFQTRQVTLLADEARHLRDVLRLKQGDDVYVFNGAGREFRCEILKTERDHAELKISDEVEPARPESPLSLSLGVALLKSDKFDLVVQKATELGVNRVIPLVTRFSDIQLRDSTDAQKRVTRWQRIALEAAKQSGRAVVPEVSMPVSITYAFTAVANDHNLRLMFAEREGEALDKACERGSTVESVSTLIGSEGGWSDDELAQARNAGWRIVTLGGRIMRAETAAIAVTAVLQHVFGDLR